MTTSRILILDYPEVQVAVQHLLSNASDITVIIARNAQDAEAQIDSGCIDMLIVDSTDGCVLAEQALNARQIPVIITSAAPYKDAPIYDGVRLRFLSKPSLDLDGFSEVLEQFLHMIRVKKRDLHARALAIVKHFPVYTQKAGSNTWN